MSHCYLSYADIAEILEVMPIPLSMPDCAEVVIVKPEDLLADL